MASPEQQPPGVRTLESLKSLFHMSMKTHDQHRFELLIELNLELTKIGFHLNGACEIVGVVQTRRGHHIVGFNVYTTQTSGGFFLPRTTSVSEVYKGRHLPSLTSFTPPSHRSPPTPLHHFSLLKCTARAPEEPRAKRQRKYTSSNRLIVGNTNIALLPAAWRTSGKE